MKFRKKPIVIDATQWFKDGDHSKVETYANNVYTDHGCKHCTLPLMQHGFIDTLEGGHIVCPGDWVITGIANENYPCKDGIFKATYEQVLED